MILCIFMVVLADTYRVPFVFLLHTPSSALDEAILVGTSPFPVTVPHKVILCSLCFLTKVLEAQKGSVPNQGP